MADETPAELSKLAGDMAHLASMVEEISRLCQERISRADQEIETLKRRVRDLEDHIAMTNQ